MFDKTTIAIKPMIQPLWNFASLLFYLLNISTYSHVNVPESNMVIDEGPHMEPRAGCLFAMTTGESWDSVGWWNPLSEPIST